MENTIVACVQQRMGIMATHEEFEAEARRFLRQAQAKKAQLVIFPELTGLMLAPPLVSGFKLGFIKRADQGSQPTAGFVSRRLGRVSDAAAGMLGGGFRGSLIRLLDKNSTALRDVYLETFGRLAREYGMVIVGGSLFLYDEETVALRNRACVFDVDGTLLGYQDKLNLAPDERQVAVPGTDLNVLETGFGRFGLLIGRDVLYPELARLLVMQGAELLVGISASPGSEQGSVVRRALAVRAEENQVFAAASFLLGPNYLDQADREDYYGQSALLAPISLTNRGDGMLVQAGTNRTEALIAADLDADALHNLWETGSFRPRQEMNLGNLGPTLARVYDEGLTIEQFAAQRVVGPVVAEPSYPSEPMPESEEVEPADLAPEPAETGSEYLPEPAPGLEEAGSEYLPDLPPEHEAAESDALPASVPEALSLTGSPNAEEGQRVE